MTKRPEYCEKAQCPNWKTFCYYQQALIVLLRFSGVKARKKEVERRNALAANDPQQIISKCSESSTPKS